MQQLDTLKIRIPVDAVRSIPQESVWTETQQMDCETGEISMKKQVKSDALPIGVSQLVYKEGGDFQLTYSAKVLGDQYLDGITLNNWDRGLDAIREILDADTAKVYQDSIVYRCDTTNNISLDQIGCKHSKAFMALLASRANQRFKDVYYNSSKKQGIEFRGIQQEKNRLIAYCKHLDLMKKDNREFMRSLVSPAQMIRDAEKQIRFEVNHTAFRSIKKRFGIKTNSLDEVLRSQAPVNYDFLRKITNVTDLKQTSLFSEYETFDGPGMDFLLYKGIQSVIRELDYSDVSVRAFFQEILGDQFKYHWYKKKNSIKKLMEAMQQKKFGITADEADPICNRILEALRQAVAA